MKVNILLSLLLLGILTACQKNDESGTAYYSFTGKAQKGPYITGTTINLNELNSNLGQTGKSFTTNVSMDDGSFHLENIELTSDLVLLTANGFFFSEIYGELSSAPLSLQAIVDLSDKETVNINILTHLIKGRIEKLVSENLSFHEANDQAKSEMLSFLGVSEIFDKEFADLDISSSEDHNAPLLAFSIMLQRFTRSMNEKPLLVAELTQLLSDLGSDFKDNGQINNQSSVDKLLHNISQLNSVDTREYLESRLRSLNQPVTIPDFEEYIAKFQEKYDPNVYTYFFYPDSASPMPDIAPDSKLENLLALNDTIFQAGKPYSMAAITPLNASLTIKFVADNSKHHYGIGGPAHGWELIDESPNGFTLNSQKQNNLMSMLIHYDSVGTAIIEYYENEKDNPTFSKNVKWE